MNKYQVNFDGWYSRHDERVDSATLADRPDIVSHLWRKWFSPDRRVEVRVRPASHNANSLVAPISIWKDGKIAGWSQCIDSAFCWAGHVMKDIEREGQVEA